MPITTKSELVTHVKNKTDVDAKIIDNIITETLDTIASSLKEGKEVRLTGFGTFSVSAIAARSGRNPRTGETLQIAASKRPVFKAGKTLKECVNG